MRLILVDNQSDDVCGVVLADVEAALDMASEGEKLQSVCKTAARMVDERRGRQERVYDFSFFRESDDKAPGYFVFLANKRCEDNRCQCCNGGNPSLNEILTRCFYVGRLHRHAE